ncbi:MAG: hypothetical protein B6D39_03340 [Anaerolineae bacterium UTCFX2]|jgi:hypothetical protein|nr:hypothetical protein [Anaerolineae bacterium]MCZ7552309.1 hypothetical protein [Anaerolineales bacterium]OQY93294.1 MAG: hypothetical protein B6D39_03340 [Anaerolineae bacterium UTCFX2]
MTKNTKQIWWSVLVLASLVFVSACSSGANKPAAPAATEIAPQETQAPEPTQAPQTFSDPFAYCAAVGTIDQPDAHYIGPKITDAILQGFIKAAELDASAEPSEVFEQSTIWRCMDHSVYACNFGANLPCDSKADTNQTPTQAMADYCKENPNSDFIPMYVTGHATIYSWHCVKDQPEVLEQLDEVDAAGFLSRIWYRIEPNP